MFCTTEDEVSFPAELNNHGIVNKISKTTRKKICIQSSAFNIAVWLFGNYFSQIIMNNFKYFHCIMSAFTNNAFECGHIPKFAVQGTPLC